MIAGEQTTRINNELVGCARCELLGLRIRYSKCDAGKQISTASSRHPHHELIYIESGEGTQSIGLDLFRARPGDVFLLAPEILHRHNDPARWSTWCLSFELESLEAGLQRDVTSLLSASRARRFMVPEPERTRWQTRFRYLLSESSEERVAEEDVVRSVMRSVLHDLEGLSGANSARDSVGRNRLLDAVFGYINAHYREAISLRDVAEAVNFSPAYLTDLVRRETGRPIHRWITERRMHAARLLLTQTDRSIAAIAEEVGFHDATYFGRHFAKVSGQTPRAWRETQRRNSPTVRKGIPWNLEAMPALDDYLYLRTLGDRLSNLQTRDEIEDALLDAAYAAFKPSTAQILRRDVAKGISGVWRQRGARDSTNFPSPRDVDGALPLVIEGQAVVAQDLARSSLEEHKRIGRLGYHSFLIAPVIVESQCIGAIRILESKPHAFSEHDRSVLAMMATLAGLAVRSAVSSVE